MRDYVCEPYASETYKFDQICVGFGPTPSLCPSFYGTPGFNGNLFVQFYSQPILSKHTLPVPNSHILVPFWNPGPVTKAYVLIWALQIGSLEAKGYKRYIMLLCVGKFQALSPCGTISFKWVLRPVRGRIVDPSRLCKELRLPLSIRLWQLCPNRSRMLMQHASPICAQTPCE